MAKARIYIGKKYLAETVEIIDKSIIHKIKNVLRFKEGEEVFVFDGEGTEYIYYLENINRDRIFLRKKDISRSICLPKPKITLAFPLVKEEKVNFILQKATELGVFSFLPFVCERSLRKKPLDNKIQRWRKIIVEAARQAERVWLPYLDYTVKFVDVLGYRSSVKFVASHKGDNLKQNLLEAVEDTIIVVGPEGDFSALEITLLSEKGFIPIKLSSNILRVETACMLSVGVINSFFISSG